MEALIPSSKLCSIGSSASDAELQSVLGLSMEVFENRLEQDTPHASLSAWRTRLQNPWAVIFYALANERDQAGPLGFFFAFPKTQPEIGFSALHIWMAGVSEKARGQGLFQRLLEATKNHARRAGFDHLTVCTIPDRFQNMYRILQKNDWQFVAWREQGAERKVLMKLKII